MQKNYRSRLFKGYALNAPWSFNIAWNGVKVLLEETTIFKIKLTTSKLDPQMLEHINLSQIE